MYFDPSYIFVAVIIMVVGGLASANVQRAYSKYGKIGNYHGITGAEAARRILDSNGLQNVRIERVSGELTDHFDPRSNVIRLSTGVHDSASIAAVGIAAHECGHAVQHAVKYVPNMLRSALVPVTNICSRLAWFVIIIGLFLPYQYLWVAYVGIGMYATAALFSLITLPVELNASKRALATVGSGVIGFSDEETAGVKSVLSAAAMTYVAALFSAVLQLLRIIFIVNRRR